MGRPEPTDEKFDVYRRYLQQRHDGQMSGSREEFVDFLHDALPFTEEVVFRVGGRLLGAGIFDTTPEALSAVYFYFDPQLAARSPGVFNVALAGRGVPPAGPALALPRLSRRRLAGDGVQGDVPAERGALR